MPPTELRRVDLPPWLIGLAEHRGLGAVVDHTLLRAETTRTDIVTLCDEAASHGLAAVCVNGIWVSLCARLLQDTPVKVVAAVGFPLGAMTLAGKAAETRLAIADGAAEIDAVMGIGQIKAGEWWAVEDELAVLSEAGRGRTVKVILETAALTREEIVITCRLARAAGVHYVKTSTGFHAAGGATAEAVALMRETVGLEMGVKASGGIRSCGDAIRMLRAGADRIGTSSAVGMLGCVGNSAPRLAELLEGAGS